MIQDILKHDLSQGVLVAALGGVLVIIIAGLVDFSWRKFKSYRDERKREFDYIWKPKTPIFNNFDGIKDVKEHKKLGQFP